MQDLLKVNESLTVKTKLGLLSPLYNLALGLTAVLYVPSEGRPWLEWVNKSPQYHLVSFVK